MMPPFVVPGIAEKALYSVLKPLLMRLGSWIIHLWRLCARHPKISLATSLVLLIVASLALLQYQQRSDIYTTVVDSTLCRETEPTAQRYKGLEAFLFSAFAPNVDAVLKKSSFANAFINRCEELKDTIKEFETLKKDQLAARKLDLRVSHGATHGLVLTDTCTKSYLFLPVNVFRRGLSPKQMLAISGNPAYEENVEDQSPFKEIIDGDMAIQNDVRFSRYVADVLESFTSIPVTDQLADLPSVEVHGKPAQVSLITKNGVNRIYNAQHGELEEYYASLFPADQFFPSRPYFRRAFQMGRNGSVDKIVPTERQTLGDYFYVSHPYVDLGGNGIVVSLVRGIEVAGTSRALLCFDLCVSKNIRRTLEDRVRMLGGETLVVDCVITGSDVDPRLDSPISEAELRISQIDMRDKVKRLLEEQVDRSDVLGNIQVLNHQRDDENQILGRGKSDENQDHLIQASIPIERVRFEKNRQSAKLLLIELDLDRFRRRTAYWLLASAIVFCVGLFPMSAVGVRVAYDDHLRKRAGRNAAGDKTAKIDDPGEVA